MVATVILQITIYLSNIGYSLLSPVLCVCVCVCVCVYTYTRLFLLYNNAAIFHTSLLSNTLIGR